MTKVKVLSYQLIPNYHTCVDETGNRMHIDITTGTELLSQVECPEDLVGKTIEIGYMHTFLYMAGEGTFIMEEEA